MHDLIAVVLCVVLETTILQYRPLHQLGQRDPAFGSGGLGPSGGTAIQTFFLFFLFFFGRLDGFNGACEDKIKSSSSFN